MVIKSRYFFSIVSPIRSKLAHILSMQLIETRKTRVSGQISVYVYRSDTAGYSPI